MSNAVLKGSAGPWVMAASTEECILGMKSGSKIDGKSERSQQPPTKCPECSSLRIWKDGLRYVKSETGTIAIQRYICRSCGRRFSETDPAPPSPSRRKPSPRRKRNVDLFGSYLNPITSHYKANGLTSTCRVCDERNGSRKEHGSSVQMKHIGSGRAGVLQTTGAKNLARVETRQEKAAGATAKSNEPEIKGKIVECAWWLKKQGRSEITITSYVYFLKRLSRIADLKNPESVKGALARLNKSESYKQLTIAAYTAFLKTLGMTWEPPKCYVTRKLPFIPTEQEIDTLIAGCGPKTATFLQLLKETAMRAGEARRLTWSDVDLQRRFVTLNKPEKRGNARIFKISEKLADMLGSLPRHRERLFAATGNSMRSTFAKSRKRIAKKLGNPKLLRIRFHTLRHWKATTLYHQTKDILHVKEFLGHKTVTNTELYIQLDRVLFQETSDQFTVKIAKTPEEIKTLLEVGFEYICEKNEMMFLRKRK